MAAGSPCILGTAAAVPHASCQVESSLQGCKLLLQAAHRGLLCRQHVELGQDGLQAGGMRAASVQANQLMQGLTLLLLLMLMQTRP